MMYIRRGIIGLSAIVMVSSGLALPDREDFMFIYNDDMELESVDGYYGSSFTDVRGHWAEDVINKWAVSGIIEGISNTEFGVEAKMTRADLCVLIARILGIKGTGNKGDASDIVNGKYYTDSVRWAIENGGLLVEDGKARPEKYITREEAAYLLYKSFNVVDSGITDNSLHRFKDKEDIDKRYIAGIEGLVGLQMMSGDTPETISPKKHLKRGECIKLLDNILDNLSRDMIISRKKDNRNFAYTENRVCIEDSELGAVNRFFGEGIIVRNSEIGGLVISSKGKGKGKGVEIGVSGNSRIKSMLVGSDSILEIEDDSTIGVLKISRGVTVKLRGDIKRGIDKVAAIDIEPEGILKIGDIEYENKSDITIRFIGIPEDSDLIEDYMLGVKISRHINNEVEIEDKDKGERKVKEQGIVGSEFIKDGVARIPTYKLFNVKHIKNGDKDYEIKLDTANKWCYRVYNILDTGEIVYGNPIFVDGYEYSINMRDGKIDIDKDSRKLKKEVYLDIRGNNIPNITNNGVYILSGSDRYDERVIETEAMLVNNDAKHKIYRGILEYSLNEYDEVNIDKYYGYKVKFSSDVGIEDTSVYPLLVNRMKDLSIEIDKGIIGEQDLIIESKIKGDINNTVTKYGIKYKIIDSYNESDLVIDGSWVDLESEVLGDGVLKSVLKGIWLNGSKVAVASYCKIGDNMIYSDIHTFRVNGSPVYNGKSKIEISKNKRAARVRLGIESKEISLEDSTIKIRDTGINKLDKECTLAGVGAKYTDGYLVFDLRNLGADKNYEIALKLRNDYGISDDIVIKLDTK